MHTVNAVIIRTINAVIGQEINVFGGHMWYSGVAL